MCQDYWFIIIIIKLICIFLYFICYLVIKCFFFLLFYFAKTTMSAYCEFLRSTVHYPPAQVWRINIPLKMANIWPDCWNSHSLKLPKQISGMFYSGIWLREQLEDCLFPSYNSPLSIRYGACARGCHSQWNQTEVRCRQKCKIFTIILIV